MVRKDVKWIPVNEIFGPTLQGEGVYCGQPCAFLRLMHCPVQCLGCDTSFTWNRTEPGNRMTQEMVLRKLSDILCSQESEFSHSLGLVVSGGEPLLQLSNPRPLVNVILEGRIIGYRWCSLETSGYVPGSILEGLDREEILDFLSVFDHIEWSPKVTPALPAGKDISLDHLLGLQQHFLEFHNSRTGRVGMGQPLAIKLVARGREDLEPIMNRPEFKEWLINQVPIFLMPFGTSREEVMESGIKLAEFAPKMGLGVSARLHSLYWGAERKR